MNASEVFEYDGEDTEDEASEADETFEAADESDEADEFASEADEASDEVWEAGGDEGEASDEADESEDAEAADEALDEALDEAVVSASARLRANRDKNRRAAWIRQNAKDHRGEIKRAVATQRGIAAQIRAIQPGGPAKVSTVGPLQGAGVVTAILPNGRRSRMRMIPTMAPISEVNRLRSVITVNDRRQAIATGNNSRAILALKAAQTGAVTKLTAEQVKSDRDLRKRLVEGDNRLDKRITKELGGGTGVVDKHGKRMMALLKRQRQRSIWNSVLLASSAPFFAAYGDRADPFSKNNLILTGSLLGWLVGDELVDSFAGNKPGVLKTGSNWWSYLAPVGNGATAYFLLNDKQHERFISGISTVVAVDGLEIDLVEEKLIAEGSADDFKKGTRHVVASPISALGSVTASVAGGKLTLGAENDGTVAWIVDTREPD